MQAEIQAAFSDGDTPGAGRRRSSTVCRRARRIIHALGPLRLTPARQRACGNPGGISVPEFGAASRWPAPGDPRRAQDEIIDDSGELRRTSGKSGGVRRRQTSLVVIPRNWAAMKPHLDRPWHHRTVDVTTKSPRLPSTNARCSGQSRRQVPSPKPWWRLPWRPLPDKAWRRLVAESRRNPRTTREPGRALMPAAVVPAGSPGAGKSTVVRCWSSSFASVQRHRRRHRAAAGGAHRCRHLHRRRRVRLP